MSTTRRGKLNSEHESMHCAFDRFFETAGYSVEKAGLSDFRLTGIVWNTEAEAFLHKSVEATCYLTERDAEWLAWAERQHKRTDICGALSIAANVVGRKFEYKGEDIEVEPIQISVGVPPDIWVKLRFLAQSSVDAAWHVSGVFRFWPLADIEYGLQNLDVSVEKTYPVHSFELSRSTERIGGS